MKSERQVNRAFRRLEIQTNAVLAEVPRPALESAIRTLFYALRRDPETGEIDDNKDVDGGDFVELAHDVLIDLGLLPTVDPRTAMATRDDVERLLSDAIDPADIAVPILPIDVSADDGHAWVTCRVRMPIHKAKVKP